jgi:hypothetical protein
MNMVKVKQSHLESYLNNTEPGCYQSNAYIQPQYEPFFCLIFIWSLNDRVNPMPGGITWLPCFWGEINIGTWPSRLEESQKLRQ